MKNDLQRREFLTRFCQAGAACCALMVSPQLLASQNLLWGADDKIDPKKLEYCGYTCPPECLLKKGTVENNTEIKKKGYETFKIKEKFGVEFDPEKIFCWTCKPAEKPLGITVKGCTVRNCAVSKGIDCCIECPDLVSCKKELWDNFPQFKTIVIEMQKKYQLQMKTNS